MTFVETHLLDSSKREVRKEIHPRLIDYLQKYHPKGFDLPCTIYVNQQEVKVEYYDIPLVEGDVIGLVFHQGVTAALIGTSSVLFNYAAALVINVAISFAIGKIFQPSMPSQLSSASRRNQGQASSVYSLNAQQNEAKVGEVIPVIYGRVRTYPALICPPYYRYENNEEYLYQLMCIGQGKYDIEKLMLSDTDVSTIQSDYFRYEKLEYADFSPSGGIESKVADANYNQLVKALADVDNLELRGTPSLNNMTMRFEGSTITFYPYKDGTLPDLSSLSAGSSITIAGTVSNDGTYTVLSVLANVVTIDSHTFVTEPNESSTKELYAVDFDMDLKFYASGNKFSFEGYASDGFGDYLYQGFPLFSPSEEGQVVKFTSTTVSNLNTEFLIAQVDDYGWVRYTYVDYNDITTETIHVTKGYTNRQFLNYDIVAKPYTATFETAYGPFRVSQFDGKSPKSVEIDYIFPSGLYNVNATTGEFENRTVDFDVNIFYAGTSTPAVAPFTISTTSKDSSPVRVSHKVDLPIDVSPYDFSVTMKRVTAEPNDTSAVDKLYIKSVKAIHYTPDLSGLGDITLLWCKIRASNAISSISQFAINGWVKRTDVPEGVDAALTDIYTNTTYGARLPLSELDLGDTSLSGDWMLDATHYATLNLGYYDIYYGTRIWYNSSSPTAGVPFQSPYDGLYYIIEAVPTLGNDTRVRTYEKQVVNGAFDDRLTVFDAMKTVAKSQRYTVYPVGSQMQLKYDAVKPLRTALFNETNIIKDSLKISYLFEEESTTDSVKVLYRDADEFKEASYTYPTNGIYPEIIELWGCTDENVAISMATYLYKQGKSRRKSVEFQTDIQGVIPQFLDRIAISHELPNWGTASEVVSINGSVVTLRDDAGTYDRVMFRNDDGSVSDILTCVPSGDSIDVISLPAWVHGYTDREPTKCSLGTSTSIVKDYIVTSIKPSGDKITIQAANYDEGIYS